MNNQTDMFAEAGLVTDLPLFSGTSMKADETVFKPGEVAQQPTLFTALGLCAICGGTGKVQVRRGRIVACPCGANRK